MALLLLCSIFIVAACGLIYELATAALASYLLGDSITQFSTVIGVYLFAMGVGSYLAKFVQRQLVRTFVQVELLIGLLGGTSAALLFFVFDYAASFRIALYLIVFLIGALVGLEIPLLMRILKERMEFRELVSNVLSFDYIGALLASVLFPLVFVPQLGLMKTCFFFGILNVLVAFVTLLILQEHMSGLKPLKFACCFVLGILVYGFAYGDALLDTAEAGLYPHPIIYSKSTPYQRIVLTKLGDELRLHLNGHLQFSSRDEYRYHEALVHVGLHSIDNPKRVLILGGGDGLAAREVLKYDSLESVTLVDLDSQVTTLFSESPSLVALNGDVFHNPKMHVKNTDAFVWLKENQQELAGQFDFVIVDFPDPTNFSVGKLYSTTFFGLLKNALSEHGLIVVQSTSPLFARKSYWCVVSTLQAAGLQALPYHTLVPSFGEWGYVLAGHGPIHLHREFLNGEFPQGLKFINDEVIPTLLQFPPDMAQVEVGPNKLNNQILVQYYEDEWSRYQ